MTRIAIVEKDKCHPVECGDFLCSRLCPINRTGQECISKCPDGKAQVDEVLCTGCGICPKRCPFGALHIINLPEMENKEPIHRFGKNGFQLFSLPTPQFGKVVGILGRNGIGKSTAIKILAGALKPNLGDFESKSKEDPNALVEYFKGSEAQSFLENLRDGKIKIAYKPQSIDLIAKNAKGTVGEMLRKVDEKGVFEEIVEKLELKNILDNEISKISGGEMQRVAIAATVMKDANVYFFDEPTSYLDIKQRIKIAKFIRDLADENTAVMVIEHDLIILDYMTDLIHLMYGKPACFGIVSQPKSTRVAINVYLSGFLKEENVRFRDSAIKFSERQPIESHNVEKLTGWEGLKNTLGHFKLSAPEGTINRHDVVGVLGENGIGKTSFVKILAGVDKPESGTVDDEVKVAYKPQYIDTGSDEVVRIFLAEALAKYENQLINPLSIVPLLDKKLNELSGGELQRVAICDCLSKDVSLHLLDEPSAYLDVEQRLNISKVIRNFMELKGRSAIVVDHDLLLLDYLSDRLMVFEGEPARSGEAHGPFKMGEGMTKFLQDLAITFRRDPECLRPRINKPDSVKDREQKSKGNYYYSD
ncbi:ribosome biogenesis/translation initiation ATPase RLI [Candidatus Woesearchaeota archaeon]|jgi:ATP-binding cassette, sub-family E, member 1|nr:ribosome biogenesis/translation initiation ATPase RLI [Candidatus Woesearchaeota archaeon]MBT3537332.1 ribosome biogenesis/translation initiation ATPase RLI [Candidatus Woesearchaeota archaeon]MBT4697398.1 ribosome biogenesis/translation initiation ATPase RLI [Candidatus Woesearchaeota archaeon]MBT4716702.1 ribosome biogenesis/translation initiation ATPase RLI [Candidatus Woesearchaeota archaeon]MBT7106358.1 ribosome biogenesis/translation initiation ATPase RLI [Candidatus Woesearchaeota arc